MVLGISSHDQLAVWPLGLCKVEPEVEKEATHLLGAKKQQKGEGARVPISLQKHDPRNPVLLLAPFEDSTPSP